MKSSVAKHSVVLAGHKTSISLEDAFWRALKEIASSRRITVRDLINSIELDREHGNLSSALRLFVLNHYQAREWAPADSEGRQGREQIAESRLDTSTADRCRSG
jgi:predicted DNA-binding ribbon-helix-helix protein